MKGIILYQSKYGATKKYADWLVEATGYDCMETKKANLSSVQNYDVIVLGAASRSRCRARSSTTSSSRSTAAT